MNTDQNQRGFRFRGALGNLQKYQGNVKTSALERERNGSNKLG